MKQEDPDVPDAGKGRPVVNKHSHRNFSLINVNLHGDNNGSHNGSILNHATQVENGAGAVLVQRPGEDSKASDSPPRRRPVWARPLAVMITLFLTSGMSGVIDVWLPETEHEFTVIPGNIKFKLPDGTKVVLGNGSFLRFIKDGFGDCREVFLDGNGVFDVNPNADVPFVIHCEDGATFKVTGGLVDIDRSKETVGAINVLVSGSGDVALYDRTGAEIGHLREGDDVTYNPYTRNVKVRKHTPGAVDKGDMLILNSLTMAEIANILEDEFAVKITVAAAVQQCSVTASFVRKGLTITQVLEAIGMALPGIQWHPVADNSGQIRRVKITGRNCDTKLEYMPEGAVE